MFSRFYGRFARARSGGGDTIGLFTRNERRGKTASLICYILKSGCDSWQFPFAKGPLPPLLAFARTQIPTLSWAPDNFSLLSKSSILSFPSVIAVRMAFSFSLTKGRRRQNEIRTHGQAIQQLPSARRTPSFLEGKATPIGHSGHETQTRTIRTEKEPTTVYPSLIHSKWCWKHFPRYALKVCEENNPKRGSAADNNGTM